MGRASVVTSAQLGKGRAPLPASQSLNWGKKESNRDIFGKVRGACSTPGCGCKAFTKLLSDYVAEPGDGRGAPANDISCINCSTCGCTPDAHVLLEADDARERGNDAFAFGDYERAISPYTRAISLAALGDARPWSNRAAAYAAMGKWSEALHDATRACEIEPTWAKARARKALAETHMGKLDAAAASYRAALKLEPNNAEYIRLLSEAEARCEASKRHAGGASSVGRKKNGDDGDKERAAALVSRGDFAGAVLLYQSLAERRPGDGLIRSNLSACYARMSRFEEALQAAREAVRVAPRWAKAHTRVAAALFYLGRYDEAVVEYKAALALKPDYEAARSGCAEARAAAAEAKLEARDRAAQSAQAATSNGDEVCVGIAGAEGDGNEEDGSSRGVDVRALCGSENGEVRSGGDTVVPRPQAARTRRQPTNKSAAVSRAAHFAHAKSSGWLLETLGTDAPQPNPAGDVVDSDGRSNGSMHAKVMHVASDRDKDDEEAASLPFADALLRDAGVGAPIGDNAQDDFAAGCGHERAGRPSGCGEIGDTASNVLSASNIARLSADLERLADAVRASPAREDSAAQRARAMEERAREAHETARTAEAQAREELAMLASARADVNAERAKADVLREKYNKLKSAHAQQVEELNIAHAQRLADLRESQEREHGAEERAAGKRLAALHRECDRLTADVHRLRSEKGILAGEIDDCRTRSSEAAAAAAALRGSVTRMQAKVEAEESRATRAEREAERAYERTAECVAAQRAAEELLASTAARLDALCERSVASEARLRSAAQLCDDSFDKQARGALASARRAADGIAKAEAAIAHLVTQSAEIRGAEARAGSSADAAGAIAAKVSVSNVHGVFADVGKLDAVPRGQISSVGDGRVQGGPLGCDGGKSVRESTASGSAVSEEMLDFFAAHMEGHVDESDGSADEADDGGNGGSARAEPTDEELVAELELERRVRADANAARAAASSAAAAARRPPRRRPSSRARGVGADNACSAAGGAGIALDISSVINLANRRSSRRRDHGGVLRVRCTSEVCPVGCTQFEPNRSGRGPPDCCVGCGCPDTLHETEEQADAREQLEADEQLKRTDVREWRLRNAARLVAEAEAQGELVQSTAVDPIRGCELHDCGGCDGCPGFVIRYCTSLAHTSEVMMFCSNCGCGCDQHLMSTKWKAQEEDRKAEEERFYRHREETQRRIDAHYRAKLAQDSERTRHLRTLGLGARATGKAAARAYRRLALRFHPDKQRAGASDEARRQAAQRFVAVTEAFKKVSAMLESA